MTATAGVAIPKRSVARQPMSEEQLKAFLEAVKADAGLQEKLQAAADADAVVTIAKATGFLISAEELKKAQAEVSTELSDEVLKGATGGVAAALLGLDALAKYNKVWWKGASQLWGRVVKNELPEHDIYNPKS